jgi:RND family efflux transporter MFP subunit
MFLIRSNFNPLKTTLNQRFVVSVVFAFLSMSTTADEKKVGADDHIVPVNIISVVFEEMAQTVIASGPVRPVSEQSLAFKVPGIVGSVMVKEGQVVKKGQPLAKLLTEEIDANVAKAQAVLADAKRQKDRFTTLTGRNMASDQTNRQAQTALEVAKADLRIAKFNRQYAVIRAPQNGRILTRNVEANELVQAAEQAFVFADEKQGWSVRLSVADVDVVKLKLNDHAHIKLDAYPNRVFNGLVREIAGRADVHSQTFEVDVLFQESQLPPLYSGLIAHTDITPSVTQSVAKLPLSAFIQASGHQGSVYVVNGVSTVELKKVNIAYLNGANAMVTSGLNEGDRVVVEGGPFIVKNSKIAIMNEHDSISQTQLNSH